MSFGGFQNNSNSAPMAEINTTPLVDVMLVLLVIFIITAPLMTSAIRVDLPNAPAQPVQAKPETIQIGIDGKGQYFWNQEPVEFAELKKRLEQSSAKTPQPELHLRADKITHYEAVAQVLGTAQQLGLSKIGFVTLPGVGEETTTPSAGAKK
jgi:biopolymer transport protein ExbD